MRSDLDLDDLLEDDLDPEAPAGSASDLGPGAELDASERIEDEVESSDAPVDPDERPDSVPISLPAGEDRSAVTPQALSRKS